MSYAPLFPPLVKLNSRSAPSTRRKFQKHHENERRNFIQHLIVFLFLSFVSLHCYFSSSKFKKDYGSSTSIKSNNLRGYQTLDKNKFITFNQDSVITDSYIDHLIMVAGHSVLIGSNLDQADTNENVWDLQDYQRGRGLPETISSHIKAGIDEAAKDPNSLLIFSGGKTRLNAGPIDEGGSYYYVADLFNLWGDTDVRARTVTEEFATDSFQNLLYSICRFREITTRYPEKITVISFSFKRQRFESMHAPALHIPAPSFHYIGVDPPVSTGFDYDIAATGEQNNSVVQFRNDPYGCYSDLLKKKRVDRNPYVRTPWYDMTCPEITELLHWCGPDLFPKEKIPWL